MSLHMSSSSSRPFTVMVEGNIGSGKTTFLQHFNGNEDVCVLAEPIELWRNCNGHNLLGLMYEDVKKWSFTFQSYVQLTMLQQQTKKTNCPIKLMERSIYSARYCFVEKMKQDGLLPHVSAAVIDKHFEWIMNYADVQVDLVDWPAICPTIIPRSTWQARKPHEVDYIIIPTKNIIIHHTVTEECDTQEDCSDIIRSIQNFHKDTLEFHDIGYNFLIGGDGNIYEGVGWHKVGAHTRGYNTRSLGIAFIGNFENKLPNKKMLEALKSLLACGVEFGALDKDYRLFGGRQVSATLSPGTTLYKELKRNWPHFAANP